MVKVRIKFDADIVIEAENLSDARCKWESMQLFSKEAMDSGVEFGETLLIENAENYDDLSKEWYNN